MLSRLRRLSPVASRSLRWLIRMSADYNANPQHDATTHSKHVHMPSESRGSWWTGPLSGRRALIILGTCLLATLALLPLDRWVLTTLGPYGGLTKNLGGDLRRELEFVQQFGAFTSMLIAALMMYLQDRSRAVRVLDLLAGILANVLVCNLLKMAFGRPRPRIIFGELTSRPPMDGYDHTWYHAFFWSAYPLPRDADPQTAGVQLTYLWAHSWEVGKGISSDLWSMPSSHAAAAACAAAALMRLYPRLSPLLIGLIVVVACARILFGAHYPSDVALGAAVGFVIGALAMDGRWGSRWVRSSPNSPT